MVNFSGSSIFAIAISLVAVAVLIFNTIYVSSFRSEAGTSGLSKTGGTVLFWIDIALIVLLGIYLIYVFFLIFTTKSDREKISEAIFKSQAGAGAISSSGIMPTGVPRM